MALPETTLANPLMEADYEEFLHAYANPKDKYRGEVGRLGQVLSRTPSSPHLSQIRRHHPEDTPRLSKLGLGIVPTEVAEAYLSEVGAAVAQLTSSLNRSLSDASNTGYPGLPIIDTVRLSANTVLVTRWKEALYWLNVVDQIIVASKSHRWVTWQGGWFSRRMALVPQAGLYHLLSLDACLMFKDMMYSRFLIHLYCNLDPLRSHLGVKLDQFISWGAEVLASLGNEGYNVIKGIEALTQTALIAREETVLDGAGQHESMLRKYKEKEIKAGGTGAFIDRLEVYLASFQASRDLAEAFGFMKLWGHPYVDPRAGCVSARDLAQADLHLSPLACLKLEWSFCHLYCRGYLKSSGRWPPLRFIPRPDGGKTALEELYTRSQPALAFGFTQYPADDWQWAQFENHIVFDRGEDILSLVEDRAISYKRSEFDASWAGRMGYRTPRPTTSARVLEELITRPQFDLGEVVQKVASRDIPRDWKIITVSPKEREMKIEPRMFSMMVMEMRLFFVLTEHNIAEGVFRYIPEQTMTMGRQELLDVFLQSTRPLPGSWVRAVLGVDFSRWNLYWRGESVHPIGRRLNEIYGTPGVFDVVHEFFEDCMCLLRSGGYPPDGVTQANRADPPQGRTLWYGHKGGFEGIAQKLWTASTVALIHMALWPLGLSYRIIGQGDNQVCVLDIYIPAGMSPEEVQAHVRHLVNQATEAIARVSQTVGQLVKPEECIQSTCFLTYGKEMILRGAYLPTALKYISRMFPSTTGDAPSLYEMISSISSGAVGAPDRNDWSYPTWVLAKMVEGITFRRELRHSLFHGPRLKEAVAERGLGGETGPGTQLLPLLLSIPANLGGYPITTVTELLYRGHSDPLSSSLLHLCLLDRLPVVQQYQRVLLKGWVLSPSPDLEGLVLDPYSIPLSSATVPSSAVAAVTGRIIPEITQNHQFKELFIRASEEDRLNLMGWLGSMNPLYPKIAHDIYKSSLVGLRDAFVRRFSNTRTIMSIGRKAGENLAGLSLESDLRLALRILDRLTLAWKVDSGASRFVRRQTYSVAVLLRRAWKGGAHLEGVTNGHPLSVGRLEWFPGPSSLSPVGCRIQVMGLSTNTKVCSTTRGPVNPYLGSGTGDKAVARWVRPIDTSPPLRDVLRLLIIRSLVAVEGGDFWTSITELAEGRSAVPLESLENLVRLRIGGTIAHRYMTRDDARGSFWNSCFNWPSHLTMSTNQSGVLGERDYPFDFKEAMLSMSALLSWAYSLRDTPPPWGIQLVVDSELMDEVSDRIVGSAPFIHPHHPPADNYYASVLKVTISPNALTSARFSDSSDRLPFPRVASSVVQAVTALLLVRLRGRNPVTTKNGHTIGVPSKTRFIDLPELNHITTEEMLEGATRAVWLKAGTSIANLSSRRISNPSRLALQSLDLEVRRGVPSFAGILGEVDHKAPSRGLGIGLGREAELNALARWMHEIIRAGAIGPPDGPFPVYRRGAPSVSSSLASALGVLAARECLSGDPHRFRAGKLLVRMTTASLKKEDEPTRVRMLVAVISACSLQRYFVVDERSPEEVLRDLRGRGPRGEGGAPCGQIYRATPPLPETAEAEGGSSRLSLPSPGPNPSRLIDSWMRRIPGVPAAAERWAPLREGHPGTQRVLLVGVGIGDIGGAFPLEWDVTGVELGEALQYLGHDSTTYVPPGLAGRFTLHSISWTHGGDITTEATLGSLCEEVKSGKYSLVVIDVEGVRNEDRLHARFRLAQAGIPAYCKVYIDPNHVDELLGSFYAYRTPSDRIWSTLAYPDSEFILGSSSSPLGVYTSVPSPSRLTPAPPPPHRDLYTWVGFNEYNPGADFLTLAGHMSLPSCPQIRLIQCRSVFSYLPPRPPSPFLTRQHFRDLCISLLANGCPRVRVKALISLEAHGLLSPTFFRPYPTV